MSEDPPENQISASVQPPSPAQGRGAAWLNGVQKHPLIVFLTSVVSAYCLGIGTYLFFLSNFRLDVVPQGSYVLKENLAGGHYLRSEAILHLTRLIDVGQVELSKKEDAEVDAWLLEARTFVHELGLPKDSVWEGQKVANAERNMLWAIQDPSLTRQAEKTLGVLRGLRAAFSSHEDH